MFDYLSQFASLGVASRTEHCCVGRAPFGLTVLPGVVSVQLPAYPSCVLYGLGGVGKTKIAVEYAYRCSYDYDLIWWIRLARSNPIC